MQLGAQVWEVDNARIGKPPIPADGAHIGATVAFGDFNGDGFDDVAVGAPDWTLGGIAVGGWRIGFGAAGRTPVLSAGLIYKNAAAALRSSTALAAGDFDGDGIDELAVGAPSATISTHAGAGRVWIEEYDSGPWHSGLSLTQLDAPLTEPENNDHFGSALAVGDFDDDGYDDLAVAAADESWPDAGFGGAVHVFFGDPTELLRTSDAVTLSSPSRAAEEIFGKALAAGDFNGDGHDDLAVGIPYRAVAGQALAGAVEVYLGTDAGLSSANPQLIDDGDFHSSAADPGDCFGWSLAAADFDDARPRCALLGIPCRDDLAIGVPGQAVSDHAAAGKVVVAYGSAAGLSTAAPTVITAATLGTVAETGAELGLALAAGHLGEGLFDRSDLAVGVPFADWGGTDDGVVHLVFGAAGGLGAGSASQLVPQRTGLGIAPAEASERFGSSLAIGDLDGDGWGDLLAGSPGEGATDAGAAQLLFGALFADGFGRGNDDGW